MERKIKIFKYIYLRLVKTLFAPIISNKIFFVNVIVLLILPSIINAYFVNYEQYITISKIYRFGIKVRDGASVPYIFFIPYTISFLLSSVSLLIKLWNKKLSILFQYCVYAVLMLLFIINVFCLLNFNTMISPAIIMLMAETNGSETFEFFSTYILGENSIIAYLIIISTTLYLYYSEIKFQPLIIHKKHIVFVIGISLYMLQRSFAPMQSFSKLFSSKDLSEAELWYLTYPVNTNVASNALYSCFIMNLSKKEMGEARQSTLAVKDTIKKEKNINIILIIGESYSKHHSNLYGYKHITNSRLQEQVNSGN